MPNFGDLNYWENRYLEQRETNFDWLEDYDSLKPYFDDILKNLSTESMLRNNLNNLQYSPNILMLGCGNSELSDKLHRGMNLKNIYNIDNSSNVIKSMAERYQNMQWQTMDAKQLRYENSFFDIVIDKATMDSVLCGDNAFQDVAMMTKEVQRVLKIHGVYILVSYGDPDSRKMHLQQEHLNFDIQIQCLKKSFLISNPNEGGQLQEKTHWIYICKKLPGADAISQQNFPNVFLELGRCDILEEEDFDLLEEAEADN
jgi:ubiquinone/menaquinone biosynthesis C-methylase UbiE